MGLGSTTKKIQLLADSAEKMYHRLNEVREQVETTQHTVDETGDRVRHLESEIVEQRAILEAIAGELDIDLAAVTADAHIPEAETATSESDADHSDEDAATDAGGDDGAADAETDSDGVADDGDGGADDGDGVVVDN